MGVVLLLLLVAGTPPTAAQAPAPSDAPPAPAPGLPPVVAPTLEPVPVIPGPQPFPPSTVPSAPQRFLPVPAAGLPLTATFQLRPTLTLSEEYTDNFNLTDRNKESNFRSTVSPGLRLLINSPFTKGVIGYTFSPSYDTATDDIEYFHSFLGQVIWDANPRWRITVADTLTRSDQPGEADSLGLRRQRETFTSNTFSLASDYLIGTVTTRASYQMSLFTSDDSSDTTSHTLAATATVPIYQTNLLTVGYDYLTGNTSGSDTSGRSITSTGADANGHQFTVRVSRQFDALRSGGLSASYALRSLTDDTGDDTDYRVWTVSAFSTYLLPGRFTLNGSVGVSGLNTDDGDNRGPSFFSATSLTYQFARAVASLAVNQGFSETFSGGQNFGVVETTSITASLFYPFTPLFSGRISGFYRLNKSTGVGNIDTGSDQDDEGWGGTAGLSLQLLRGLLLDLTYNYRRQYGADGSRSGTGQQAFDRGYTENRVRAAITISFP